MLFSKGPGCELSAWRIVFPAEGFLKSDESNFPLASMEIVRSRKLIAVVLCSIVKQRLKLLIEINLKNSFNSVSDPDQNNNTSSM